MTTALRILNVLGQRPEMTGSGVLVTELHASALASGDTPVLICAGYTSDDFTDRFGSNHRRIDFATDRLPFAVPGMSDVMPYTTVRYADLSSAQLGLYLREYGRVVAEVVQEFKPHLVHIHHLWVLASLAQQIEVVPVAVTVHGTGLKLLETAPSLKPLVERSLPHIAQFFCVSRDMAADMQSSYGVDSDRISVLGNGFNDRIFGVSGPAEQIEGKVVLCAGKFVAWKGFRYLIEASARVGTPHLLVIAGTGSQQCRDELAVVAQRNGANVLFTGHLRQEKLASWMRRADLFVLPSLVEPFGLVLLEAMACGCPAIAAAAGGPLEVVSDGLARKGLCKLVPPLADSDAEVQVGGYVGALAQAVYELLQVPRSTRVRHLVAASVRHRTWNAVYKDMRSVYSSLARGLDGTVEMRGL